MYCSKCGEKNPDGATYCYNCGAPLINEKPVDTKQTDKSESDTNNHSSPIDIAAVANETKQSDIDVRIKNKKKFPLWLILILTVACAIGGCFVFRNITKQHIVRYTQKGEKIKNIYAKIDSFLTYDETLDSGTDNEITVYKNDDDSVEKHVWKSNQYTTYFFGSYGNIDFNLHKDDDTTYSIQVNDRSNEDSDYIIGIYIYDVGDFSFAIINPAISDNASFVIIFNKDGTLDTEKMKEYGNSNTYPGMDEVNYNELVDGINGLLKKVDLSMNDFINADDLKYYVCSYNPNK